MRKVLLYIAILAMLVGSCAATSLVYLKSATRTIATGHRQVKSETHLLYLQPYFFAPSLQERGVLTYEDVMELKQSVPEIEHISIWDRGGLVQMGFRDKVYPDWQAKHKVAPIVGAVTPQLQDVFGLELLEGRFISERDVQDRRRFCVIGGKIHERLGGGNVIGEALSLDMLSSDGLRTREIFIIVGVLKNRLPLYAPLPDRVFYELIPYVLKVPTKDISSYQTARAIQREQLAAANFALNESVLLPYMAEYADQALSPSATIYLQVNVSGDNSSGFVLDRESMIGKDVEHNLGPASSYWPQGVAEAGGKIREVLRARVGSDKVFQFLYQGTYSDYLRLQTGPLVMVLIITHKS
ncbi:MAG: ABC transporter permease [Bacillota bacterium]|nr:ABC transporter permease [Bacillota bacterium]